MPNRSAGRPAPATSLPAGLPLTELDGPARPDERFCTWNTLPRAEPLARMGRPDDVPPVGAPSPEGRWLRTALNVRGE